MKIRELDISARAKMCLLTAGYEDIEDLERVTDEELLNIRNLNGKGVAEIRATIDEYFISKDEPEDDEDEFEDIEDGGNYSDLRDIPLDELEFSVRTYNCLKRAGIASLSEICEKTMDDMMHVRNLGRKSLEEILAKLKVYGLSLSENDDDVAAETYANQHKCFLKYESINGILTRCIDCEAVIYIPNDISEIGANAFESISSVRTIYIPKSVTKISNRAFQKCDNLEEVIIEDGLVEIGDYVFESCKKLNRIAFPGTLKTIGRSVFARCESMKELVIPDSVVAIGPYMFERGLFNGTVTKLVLPKRFAKDCQNMNLPNVCNISYLDLDPSGFEVTNGVLTICGDTSYEVTTPKHVSAIGDAAFQYLQGPRRIIVTGNVQKIGKRTFQGCSTLEEIIIEEGVTEIEEYAFESCVKLKKVVLPNSLQKIGKSVFARCESMKELFIPDSVEFIGSNMFERGLYKGTLIKLSLPRRFANQCDQMNLSKECAIIFTDMNDAGFELDNGTLVMYTKDESVVHLTNDVVKIGDRAFQNLQSLKSIRIPRNVKTIGIRAFQNCSNLEEIIIEEGVIEIGDYAFESCGKLKKINFPKSLKRIGKSIFARCESIKELIIPDNVDIIGSNMFERGLYRGTILKLTIPKRFASQCENLNLARECSIVYSDLNSKGYETSGSTLTLYGKQVSTIEMPIGIREIGGRAFQYHQAVKRVIISSNVHTIGTRAFQNCSNVEEIIIEEGVTEIGDYTFESCSKLKRIVLPKSLKIMGKAVFARCESLKELTIPEQVQNIGPNMFERGLYKGTVEILKIPRHFQTQCKNMNLSDKCNIIFY